MSLATRCTSCGTAFRVVQDQLKVSEGWVRCGNCAAVFSALEGLFDLGRDAPADRQEPATPVAAGVSPAQKEQSESAGSGHDVRAPAAGEDSTEEVADDSRQEEEASGLGELLADPVDAHLFGPRKRTEAGPKPAGELGARDRVEFSDARFDSDLFPEDGSIPDTELVEMPATDTGELPLESTVRPEFIRRADRRAHWQSTPMRAALGGASVLALCLLVLQAAHHHRDSLAADSPALRGALTAWCSVAGCRVEAPRRLQEIVVETTGLTRAPMQDAFLLSVTLKSRSRVALTMPAFDLALTDGTGRLIARRALLPRDFGAGDVMPAGAEAPLQLLLTAGTPSVVGYTVEIFYP